MKHPTPIPPLLLRVLPLFVLLFVGSAVAAGAASRYDPRLRFRTISTPRFDIHFHQGEEADARRLAVIAEEVAAEIDRTLGPAAGRVNVVLVNQNDLPNGWATPVPYNLIEIAAAGPAGESLIGNTTDWLRLVFTHEYTHVVHLSRSGGWIRGLHRVFGRNPALFPNLTLPLWTIEGIATYEESALTGRGRLPAGDFRQIVARAAETSRFEPLDRASGGLVDWPAGIAPYAYGGYFNQFLADRYGAASLRRLTDESARRLPYFGSTAYRRVFGRSLDELWKDFEADTAGRAMNAASVSTRLTHHGFDVASPAFGPDGRIYYSIVNPHGFPALMRTDAGGPPQRITTRYLGGRIGFSGRLIVFDQLDFVQSVGLQSDLYVYSPDTRRTTRLTRGARAADPNVSPDGRTIVCTIQRGDRRELATLDFDAQAIRAGAVKPLVSEAGTEFAAPKWAPDGRRIAVERHVRGALPEIVLVDSSTGGVQVAAAGSDERNTSPVWTPDGSRVLFASARGGSPFRIASVSVDTLEIGILEGTGVSAESPAVSADGRTLVYVGYTPDGYDLFSLALSQARWVPAARAASARQAGEHAPSAAPRPSRPDRPYVPWPTLRPTFWTPSIVSDSQELVFGAATGGADALGRHGYAAGIGWAASRLRPDWQIAYTYDRWRPTLFANVSNDTDPWRLGETRSIEANVGAVLPFRRVRAVQSLFGALHLATDTLACSECAPAVDARADRRSIRTGWSFSSARSYGYSISREEGWSATLSHELIRRALGSEGNGGALIADVRGYRHVRPQHGVLAARFATAHAWGDAPVRREFTPAGNGPPPDGFAFGFDAIGLLRGFDDDLGGRHAAVLNLDYRVPFWRPQRGSGTLPIFARAVHGAIFLDAGHAWDTRFTPGDARVSAGAEISMDAVLGYVLPVTITTGAALRRDGAHGNRDVAVFGRIGRAF